MSFFTNLHQYVSNSVAGLSLSPRRLPTFSRVESSSTTTPVPEPVSPSMIDQGRVWKSNPPLPARTIPHLLQERSQSLKSSPVINAAASKRNSRASSLKEAPSPTTMDPHQVPSGRTQRKPKLIPTFALREIPQKSPWPLFAITGSGVQETDASFFESFTALQWKQENRRLQALKQSPVQQCSADLTANQKDSAGNISTKELEQLYVEVMYTIRHKIGAHSTQYPHHYQEDLIRYAQTAFSMEPQQHRRCQALASEEKPPIVVLNVVVMEADGLEAKDPNGFSDPYCMLGIQPGVNSGESHHTGGEPEPEPERRNSLISLGQIERLRKNHSFRLSFRRRDNSFFSSSQSSSGRGSISSNSGGSSGGSSKEHRDSLSSVVPAKFIRATTVKTQTLTPKWNEKFKFDIDDVDSDILHLDIWDHDDEYSVLDAVSKLNEVRGVKGLGRFFKQIAQSARSGNQDDFLGSINIPIQEIPSTGVEKWYPLEGRSQRSSIQGRIRLKMWLSTREDFGNSEEDNWTDIKQQEQLYSIFIDYELKSIKDSVQWSGELSPTAQVILHQHAIQGDVTVLQSSVVRWIVISRKFAIRKFHYSLLCSLLQQIDEHWGNEQLSRDEEEALGVSLTTFIDFALSQIKKIRKLFLPNDSSMSQLDFLLRCLMFLEEMQAFRRCCPFHKAVRGEITNAVRKGTLEWFDEQQEKWLGTDPMSPSAHITGLVAFVNAIYADLDRSLQVYNDIFMSGCGLSYFTAVYKSHVKMMNESIPPMLEIISSFFGSTGEAEDLVSEVFELYTALQDLQKFQDAVPKDESQAPPTLRNYQQSFRMPLEQWLILARSKAHGRIRSAVHLDSLTTVDSYYQHSTSAIDATSCFYQICEFWKQLNWPISAVPYPFVYGIAEIICSSAILYADLISHRPQNAGHYLDDISESPLNDELFVTMNNLEHVKSSVNKLPQDLQISSIVASVDSALYVENQRSPVQSRARSPSIISHSPGTSTLLTGLSTYESSARHTFHTLFETFNEHYESKLQKTVSAVTEKMRSELRKNLFHLAWSPDSLPVDQSVAPLLEYLDQQLILMQPALSPPAFQRCVLAIWDVCLCELWNHAEASAGEKFCAFYDRLYNGLEVLLYFLHGDGKGAPLDTLRSSMYLKVNEKIWLHKTSTEHLIDSYYARRLEEQLQQQQHILHNTPYGILSIRAYFHYDTLYIEILSAKDVIPLDPNGLSDPFVIVELHPRRIFDSCSERQTAVHRKTLNPVFDECFEFHVTLEQCKMDSAFILLTVMDYDVLTANDFAGEAFLALKSVPGIATGPHSLETLRGLKPTDLVLMQQQQKNHPILAVLETRKWDRQAQEFVRKQKERIAS